MDGNKKREIAVRIGQTKSERNRFLLWPQLDSEALKVSGDYHEGLAGGTYDASISMTNEFHDKKAELEKDPRAERYGKSWVRDTLKEHFKEDVLPKLDGFRGEVMDQIQGEAANRIGAAKAEALPKPTDRWDIAIAMEDLRTIREKKLSVSDVEQMPRETRAAVALSPPHLSGLNEHNHKIIYKSLVDETSGALAEAHEFDKAVKAAADAVDHCEVACELAIQEIDE